MTATVNFAVGGGVPVAIAQTSNSPYNFFDNFLSSMFKYRVGGHKRKVYFSCTTQHSGRFVFFLSPSSNLNGVTTYQFCHHQIVDVIGPGEHEIFFPQMTQAFAQDNDSNPEVWKLFVQCISYSAPLGYATPFVLVVYASAAEDVQYSCLKDRSVTFTSESSPRQEFKRPFPPLHEGMKMTAQQGVLPDTYDDIRQIMKTKFCQVQLTSGTSQVTYPQPAVTGSNRVEGLSVLNLLYLFWRGSIVFKTASKDSATHCMMAAVDINGNYCPCADFGSHSISVSELKMPMYGTRRCVPTMVKSEANGAVVQVASNAPVLLYTSAGDDYTVSHLQWPSYTPLGFNGNSAVTGTGLAQAYFAT